jgi:hypothetical protein
MGTVGLYLRSFLHCLSICCSLQGPSIVITVALPESSCRIGARIGSRIGLDRIGCRIGSDRISDQSLGSELGSDRMGIGPVWVGDRIGSERFGLEPGSCRDGVGLGPTVSPPQREGLPGPLGNSRPNCSTTCPQYQAHRGCGRPPGCSRRPPVKIGGLQEASCLLGESLPDRRAPVY